MASYLSTPMAHLFRTQTGILAVVGCVSAWLAHSQLWPAARWSRGLTASSQASALDAFSWAALVFGALLAAYGLFRVIRPNSAVRQSTPVALNVLSQYGWHLMSLTAILGCTTLSLLAVNPSASSWFTLPTLAILSMMGLASTGLLDLSTLVPETPRRFLPLPTLQHAKLALLVPGGPIAFAGLSALITRSAGGASVLGVVGSPTFNYVIALGTAALILGLAWKSPTLPYSRARAALGTAVTALFGLSMVLWCFVQTLLFTPTTLSGLPAWLIQLVKVMLSTPKSLLALLTVALLTLVIAFVTGKKKA